MADYRIQDLEPIPDTLQATDYLLVKIQKRPGVTLGIEDRRIQYSDFLKGLKLDAYIRKSGDDITGNLSFKNTFGAQAYTFGDITKTNVWNVNAQDRLTFGDTRTDMVLQSRATISSIHGSTTYKLYSEYNRPKPGDLGDPANPSSGAYTKAEIDAGYAKRDGVTYIGLDSGNELRPYVRAASSNNVIRLVPQSTTVNGKALTGNITLTAGDVSAYSKVESDNGYAPKTRKINGYDLSADRSLTANDVGAYSKTEADGKYALLSRKINGKQLNADITLIATDVSAVGLTGDQTIAGNKTFSAPTIHNGALSAVGGINFFPVLKTFTATDNMNNMQDGGFYNCLTINLAQNAPPGVSYGTLEVVGHGNATTGNYITQKFTEKGTGKILYRISDDTQPTRIWSAWSTVYSTAVKPSASDVGAVDLLNAQTINGQKSFKAVPIVTSTYPAITLNNEATPAGIIGKRVAMETGGAPTVDKNGIAHTDIYFWRRADNGAQSAKTSTIHLDMEHDGSIVYSSNAYTKDTANPNDATAGDVTYLGKDPSWVDGNMNFFIYNGSTGITAGNLITTQWWGLQPTYRVQMGATYGGSSQMLFFRSSDGDHVVDGTDVNGQAMQSGTWSGWHQIYHDGHKPTAGDVGAIPTGGASGSCTGNSATATKLQTACKINGVPFDGSGDITIGATDSGKLPLAGGTITGGLTVKGQIVASATNHSFGDITITSDIRRKRNMQKIKSALDKVCLLNGYSYEVTGDGKSYTKSMGVSAQEVRDQFPDLVKEDDEGFLSVNYNGLVGVLVEAIKELRAEI